RRIEQSVADVYLPGVVRDGDGGFFWTGSPAEAVTIMKVVVEVLSRAIACPHHDKRRVAAFRLRDEVILLAHGRQAPSPSPQLDLATFATVLNARLEREPWWAPFLPETVGQCVRRYREEADLTIDQLAKLAIVERSTIINVEGGKHRPTPTIVRKLQRALSA